MECIEARALKSSFLSQMAMKTNSLVFQNDDVWCLTGINTVPSDDFLVEDLLNLDFSEKELQDGFDFNDDDGDKASQKRNSSNSESKFSGNDEFDSLSAGELTVPVDELENLEWLSQFVEDSTSELSLPLPAVSFSWKTGGISTSRVVPVSMPVQIVRSPCFPLPVPVKARSKRSRSHARPWSLESRPLSAAEASATASSSDGSSTYVFTDWFSSVEKPAVKKIKRKSKSESGLVSGRRCTHCQVQKTPQWRTGPLGPKTLCNACGVRFKSGRLFPEYRPACSPNFSQEVHSNSHRKVLEMRQKKVVGSVVETGLTRVVQSF